MSPSDDFGSQSCIALLTPPTNIVWKVNYNACFYIYIYSFLYEFHLQSLRKTHLSAITYLRWMLSQCRTSSLLFLLTSSSLTSMGNNRLCNCPNTSVRKKSMPENKITLLTNIPLSKEVWWRRRLSVPPLCAHTRGSETDENKALNASLAGGSFCFAGTFVFAACHVPCICLLEKMLKVFSWQSRVEFVLIFDCMNFEVWGFVLLLSFCYTWLWQKKS